MKIETKVTKENEKFINSYRSINQIKNEVVKIQRKTNFIKELLKEIKTVKSDVSEKEILNHSMSSMQDNIIEKHYPNISEEEKSSLKSKMSANSEIRSYITFKNKLALCNESTIRTEITIIAPENLQNYTKARHF